MKNYDERFDSIMKKYDERLAAEKRRKKLIAGIAIPSGVCAAAVVGVVLLAGGDPKGSTEFKGPDSVITETSPSVTETAPSASGTTAPAASTAASETTAVTSASTSGSSTGSGSTSTGTSTTSGTTETTGSHTTTGTETTASSTTSVTTTAHTTTTESELSEPVSPVDPPHDTPTTSPVGPAPEIRPQEDPAVGQFYHSCELLGRSYEYSYWVDWSRGDFIGEVVAYGSDPTYGLIGSAHFYDDNDVSLAIAVSFSDKAGYYIYKFE